MCSGAATPERIALSDKICAGLQVIEHLQDVDEDRARGRVYISWVRRRPRHARRAARAKGHRSIRIC